MQSLREIFINEVKRNGSNATDKSRGDVTHLSLYEQLFPAYRLSASKVFEVGIRRGGSINAWRDYFSNATIYGLDIDEKAVDRVKGDRVVSLHLDQSDKGQLESFGKDHGPFDIGIDDGSHIWSHQILTFESLWKHICPGGLYVIEDTLTSYPTWLKNSNSAKRIDYAQGNISAVEYFKNLVDEVNFDGNPPKDKSKFTDIQKTVDWIAFRSNSIFIKRRNDA